ncbi:MAG: hypothetical protein U0269_32460 [Polyangiales bacterium]
MALTDDWSTLEESAHKESPRALRKRLEALDWPSLSIDEDLPRLRRLLQRLEQRYGVRPTHRWISQRVLERARDITAEHGFIHTDGAITGVALSPDGRWLATCNEWDMDESSSELGSMGLWDALAGRLVQHSERVEWGLGQRYGSGPGQLLFSPDSKYVHALQPSASGVLWSTEREALFAQVLTLVDSGIGSNVHGYWTADNKLAFQLGPISERPFEIIDPTVDDDIPMASLRLLGGGERAPDEEDLGIGGWFIRAHFSATLPRAVCVASEGSIYIVDTEANRVIEWHSQRRRSTEDVSPNARLFQRVRDGAITFRNGGAFNAESEEGDAPLAPDGRSYVCVRDQQLCAVDLETQRVLVVLSDKPRRVHDVRWDPSGDLVAVASKKAVEIFSVRTATKLATLAIDTRPPSIGYASDRRIFDRAACAFSRGRTLFAAVDRRGVIHCYDADFREIATAKARRRTSSLAWAKDDEVLVSWGEGLLEFWDTRALWNAKPLRRIGMHEHVSIGEKPGRNYTCNSKRLIPDDIEEVVGPALDEPEDETHRSDGISQIADDARYRDGAPIVFFAVPGEEQFSMFALYPATVRKQKRWVLVCRPEHAKRVLASAALVVDGAHGWPFAWAANTRYAKVAHTWSDARAVGAPSDERWRSALMEG